MRTVVFIGTRIWSQSLKYFLEFLLYAEFSSGISKASERSRRLGTGPSSLSKNCIRLSHKIINKYYGPHVINS